MTAVCVRIDVSDLYDIQIVARSIILTWVYMVHVLSRDWVDPRP